MDWDLGDVSKYAVFDGPNKSANSYKIETSVRTLLKAGVPCVLTYPRAGRHWLMLALECYFQESISYDDSPWSDNHLPEKMLFLHEDQCDKGYPPVNNYLCLYRKDIVACIFSHFWKAHLFAYHPDHIHRAEAIRKELACDRCLFEHLDFVLRWFRKYHPRFSNRSVWELVTFEQMCDDMSGVLRKVCNFLGEEYREEDAQRVLRECTKEVVAACCEPFAVNLSVRYKELRELFRAEQASRIFDYLLCREPQLGEVVDCV